MSAPPLGVGYGAGGGLPWVVTRIIACSLPKTAQLAPGNGLDAEQAIGLRLGGGDTVQLLIGNILVGLILLGVVNFYFGDAAQNSIASFQHRLDTYRGKGVMDLYPGDHVQAEGKGSGVILQRVNDYQKWYEVRVEWTCGAAKGKIEFMHARGLKKVKNRC